MLMMWIKDNDKKIKITHKNEGVKAKDEEIKHRIVQERFMR